MLPKIRIKLVLAPIDRAIEVLAGVIMVLTFTNALSVSHSGKPDVRAMLIGSLGCNLAWGIIDGIMYLMNCLAARGHKLDAFRALRAFLGAVALCVEALQSPETPFAAWVHERKGHPGQIAVAAYLREMLEGSLYTRESGGQACYSLRCAPQGLGQIWEALQDSRAAIER